MGNSQERALIQSRLQNGEIRLQDIARFQQQFGNIDGVQYEPPKEKIIIDSYYSKQFPSYYNLTKRIHKQSITKRLRKPRPVIKTHVENIQYNFDQAHTYLPNQQKVIAQIDSEPYNITVNNDGDMLLVTSRQGLDIFQQSNETNQYEFDSHIYPGTIAWTITDSDLSTSGDRLIHSTLNSIISVYDIDRRKYHMFNIKENPNQEDDDYDWGSRVRVFSVKFNSESNRFIASTGALSDDKAYLKEYDIRHEYLTKSIPAHKDDINTICYLNRENSYLFASGSDDSQIKLWDTRALGINNNPAGYLLGHVCGITGISSREDGNYLASNSKDQSLKIWDIRKVCTSDQNKPSKSFFYDYRGYSLNQTQVSKIKAYTQDQNYDNSVQTFYGHTVQRTLIKCHFSPFPVTGSRYVYTASACGKIYVYDLINGKTAAILDNGSQDIIRDVAWHPLQHKIFQPGWDSQLVEWSFNPDKVIKEDPQDKTQTPSVELVQEQTPEQPGGDQNSDIHSLNSNDYYTIEDNELDDQEESDQQDEGKSYNSEIDHLFDGDGNNDDQEEEDDDDDSDYQPQNNNDNENENQNQSDSQ